MSTKEIPMACGMCGLKYVLPTDAKTHQNHHREMAVSYDKAMKRYGTGLNTNYWPGRPEREDSGTYLALNELNPRMLGFTITGPDKCNLKAFQAGDGEVIPYVVSGDGHDRGGIWITSGGEIFTYTANWRCGDVHFTHYTPKNKVK